MRQSNPFHSSRQGQLGSNWNCSETLKLPKIALEEPLLFLSAHSCHSDCYDDDNGNDENDDDWTGGRATEEDMHQRTQPPHAILVNSDDDHTWYPYQFRWYLTIQWTKYQIRNNTNTQIQKHTHIPPAERLSRPDPSPLFHLPLLSKESIPAGNDYRWLVKIWALYIRLILQRDKTIGSDGKYSTQNTE